MGMNELIVAAQERQPRVLEMLKTVQEAAAEREACAALLLEIKHKCQDADRLWQVEEFVDEAIRARSEA